MFNAIVPDSATPIIGLDLQDANGGVVAEAVYGCECSDIAVLIHLKPGAAATAAEQVTIKAFSQDETASVQTQLELDRVAIAKGTAAVFNPLDGTGPLLKNGTGRLTPLKLEDVAEWQTPVVDGNLEMLLAFNIRSRAFHGSQRFLRVELSGLTASRFAGVTYIRNNESAGQESTREMYP